MAIAKILAEFNLVVRYGIAIRIYVNKKLDHQTAKFSGYTVCNILSVHRISASASYMYIMYCNTVQPEMFARKFLSISSSVLVDEILLFCKE